MKERYLAEDFLVSICRREIQKLHFDEDAVRSSRFNNQKSFCYYGESCIMNHGEHFVIGIVVFFVYNFFNNTIINGILHPLIGFSIGTIWLIGAFLAAFGAVIPDQLEPASHWTHRSTFHSKTTLGIAVKIFAVTAIIALLNPLFYYISCFFLGYVSHLVADSTTKVGLPEY